MKLLIYLKWWYDFRVFKHKIDAIPEESKLGGMMYNWSIFTLRISDW